MWNGKHMAQQRPSVSRTLELRFTSKQAISTGCNSLSRHEELHSRFWQDGTERETYLCGQHSTSRDSSRSGVDRCSLSLLWLHFENTGPKYIGAPSSTPHPYYMTTEHIEEKTPTVNI